MDFQKAFLMASVLPRLGPANLFRVGRYRLALPRGTFEKRMPIGDGYADHLFVSPPVHGGKAVPWASEILVQADMLLEGRLPYFSAAWHAVGSPPDWFQNPMTSKRCPDGPRHWSRTDDGDPQYGDIKLVWEPSRWDWALILARAWCCSGELRYLQTLNDWGADWTTKNPFCCGPNWKCGQEAAIRLLQALLTAFLLRQLESPSPSLLRFAGEHCRRIPPTISYAIAQDNNHGTSEAAALFVGGSWLAAHTESDLRQQAVRWQALGRKWLENRVGRLVAADGSFSQYSLNYHRVLVDTLNLVEFWRRLHSLPPFSPRYYERCRAAVDWLYHQIDPSSGDGPNLGSNDGARLFNLSTAAYRDFRPSVQLGAALFFGARAYSKSGAWDEPLYWLEIDNREAIPSLPQRTSRHFTDGGYVLFCPAEQADTWGLLRYPRFRFRPHHGDGLHFDLWHRGVNVLRDSGTYSYQAESPWREYFTSSAAHNTIQFDGRDQMPIIGRFLYGAWARMEKVGSFQNRNGISWSGTMRDYRGASHQRSVSVQRGVWRIEDEIQGFREAVLHWRLAPGAWRLQNCLCQGPWAELSVRSEPRSVRSELVEGWESRHYWEKTTLPVWEIEVRGSRAKIITEITLKDGHR